MIDRLPYYVALARSIVFMTDHRVSKDLDDVAHWIEIAVRSGYKCKYMILTMGKRFVKSHIFSRQILFRYQGRYGSVSNILMQKRKLNLVKKDTGKLSKMQNVSLYRL